MIEKVSEEHIGQQPGGFMPGLTEGISPTEKSVTVSSLTQGVSGTLEHEYPVLLFWAKSQPWLGFGGGASRGQVGVHRSLHGWTWPAMAGMWLKCRVLDMSPLEGGELSESETHHGDVFLQHLHCLIGSPAGKLSRSQLKLRNNFGSFRSQISDLTSHFSDLT